MKYFSKFPELYGVANTFIAQNNLALKANQTRLLDVVRNNLTRAPSNLMASACALWFENTPVTSDGTFRDVLIDISASHIVDDIITHKGFPNVVTSVEGAITKPVQTELDDAPMGLDSQLSDDENAIIRKQQEAFLKEANDIALKADKEDASDCGEACKI